MIFAPVTRETAPALLLLAGAGLAFTGGLPTAPVLLLGLLHGAVVVWRTRWIPALLALDLALVAWEAATLSPLLFGYHMDTWMHLALARRVAEHGPFPPDAYYRGYGAAPVLSLVHQVLGAAGRATGEPLHELWRRGPAVAVAALGAAAWFAHRELFRDPRAALYGALFALTLLRPSWFHAVYPRMVAPVFFFLALGLLFRTLRGGGWLGAAASGACLGLSLATHPVTGAMATGVVGLILLVEGALRRRDGVGFARFVRMALALIGAALLTAGPTILLDVQAWLGRVEVAPIVDAGPQTPPRSYFLLRFFESLEAGPALDVPPYAGFRTLWIGALALGALAIRRRAALEPETRRLLLVYGLSGGLVSLVAFGIPWLTALAEAVVGPRYTARFVLALPLPALAAVGVALAADARTRSGAALAVALATAALLRGVEPWTGGAPEPAFDLGHPELARLEPLLRDRVVVTDAETAYLLPYLTGAYVTYNVQGHTNPWLYDPGRQPGARAIVAGRYRPRRLRAYAARYAVDYVLLPPSAPARARTRLLDAGFQRRAPPTGGDDGGYALFERPR